jgi:uncharacterized protein
MQKNAFLPLLCLGLFALASPVFCLSLPKEPDGFVSDYANIISDDVEAQLEQKLQDFEKQTSNEIAVVTIKSLDSETIETAAFSLFNEWGIGKQAKDNGVLLLVSLDDRKMRIEVGYGLEGALTDLIAGQIIDYSIIPAFKEFDYDSGITDGINEIMLAITGEYSGEPASYEKINYKDMATLLVFGLMFVLYVFIELIERMSNSKAIWPGGLMGLIFGILISLFFILNLYSLLIIFGCGLLGLLIDLFLSRSKKAQETIKKWSAYKQKHGGLGTVLFGGFGGRSSGGRGGGFGGFGGGSSGGGGASGSW